MAMLRVDEVTARKLVDFKGKKSSNLIINEMIDFFLNTGMRVTDNVASPIIVTQQESQKINKLLKGIDTKQTSILKDILERVNYLVDGGLNKPIEKAEKENENYMNIEEVQNLIEEYRNLEKKLTEKDSEITSLRLENDNLREKNNSLPTGTNINVTIISECLDKLCERKQSTMFDSDKITIRKSDFNMCINTIREELKR